METLEIEWKQLERHPLSAEYEDLTGERWEALVADVKATGFDATRPIILHEGKVLDGWQRLRVCIVCDVEPTCVELPSEADPETYVRRHNDNRRHETESQRKQRIEARRQRVAQGRAEGKSLRAMAVEEGVSDVTILKDVKANESGANRLAPETEATKESACDATASPEHEVAESDQETPKPETPPAPKPSPTVTGRDGKTYQATKQKPKPKPTEPPDEDSRPEEVKDAVGKVVPEKALKAFADAATIGTLCRDLDGIIKRVEEMGRMDGGRMLHIVSQVQTLTNVRKSLWQGRATHLCPYCKGNGTCEPCKSRGWTTKTFYDQAPEAIRGK